MKRILFITLLLLSFSATAQVTLENSSIAIQDELNPDPPFSFNPKFRYDTLANALYVWQDGAWTQLTGGGSTDAADINITDAGGFYTSGNVEGGMQEIGDSIADLRTDLTAIASGAADGYAQSATYDQANEEIDVDMAAPANDFSIDVSALTSDSQLADSTAAVRADFPVNTDTQLSQEQVEDFAGAMYSGNTETLITATYQDGDGTIDLVVEDDLSLYDNTTSDFATQGDIPTNVSELTNDAGYITSQTDDQTATEVAITDSGAFYTSGNVEGALQEVGDSIADLRTDLTAIAGGAADGYVQSGSYNSGLDQLELDLAAPANDVNIDMSTMARLTAIQDDPTIDFTIVTGNTVTGAVIPDNTSNDGIITTANGVAFDPDGEDTFDPTASGLPGTVNTIQEGITANASNIAALDILVGQRATQSALVDTAAAIRADIPNNILTDGDKEDITVSGGGGGVATWTINDNAVQYNDLDQSVRDSISAASNGITDGDKGDITVSSSFSNWQINANAVGSAEIATDAVTSSEIAVGSVGASELVSTAVMPGSYTNTNLTVDDDGRITSASNGTDNNGLFSAANNGSTLGVTGWSLGGNTIQTMDNYSFLMQGFNSGVYTTSFGQDAAGRWVMNSSNGAGNVSYLEVYPEDGLVVSSANAVKIKTPAVNNATATVGQVLQLSNIDGTVEFADGGSGASIFKEENTSTAATDDSTNNYHEGNIGIGDFSANTVGAGLHIYGTSNATIRLSDSTSTDSSALAYLDYYRGHTASNLGRIGYTNLLDADLYVTNKVSGGSVKLGTENVTNFELLPSGQLILPQYDNSSTITGTKHKLLALTSSGEVIPVDTTTGSAGGGGPYDNLIIASSDPYIRLDDTDGGVNMYGRFQHIQAATWLTSNISTASVSSMNLDDTSSPGVAFVPRPGTGGAEIWVASAGSNPRTPTKIFDVNVDGSGGFYGSGQFDISGSLLVGSSLEISSELGVSTSDLTAVSIESSNASGIHTVFNSKATGGKAYRIISSANGAGFGGGKFSIYSDDDSKHLLTIGSENTGIQQTSPAFRLDVGGTSAAVRIAPTNSPPAGQEGVLYANDSLNSLMYYNGARYVAATTYQFTPTSTADSSGSQGDVAYDDNYIYVKTSAGWKRSALSTF